MSYGLLRRWSRAARTSSVEVASGPARRTFRLSDLEHGWLVLDSVGRRVGTIVDAADESLTVSQGLLLPRLHVARRAIADVHEGVVRLNVPLAWLKARETS